MQACCCLLLFVASVEAGTLNLLYGTSLGSHKARSGWDPDSLD